MKALVLGIMLAAAPETEPEVDTSRPLQCEKFGQALTVGAARARAEGISREEYLATAGLKDPTALASTVRVSSTVKLGMDAVYVPCLWPFEIDKGGAVARVVATGMCRDLERRQAG